MGNALQRDKALFGPGWKPETSDVNHLLTTDEKEGEKENNSSKTGFNWLKIDFPFARPMP